MQKIKEGKKRKPAEQKLKAMRKAAEAKKKKAKTPENKQLPILSKADMVELVPEYKSLGLSLSELKFSAYYIFHDGNATEAYQSVHNRVTRQTAGRKGSAMLKRPNVQDAIELWRREWFEDIRQQCRDKAVKMLATQAFYDPADIINASGNFRMKPNPKYDKDAEPGSMESYEFIPSELSDIPPELRRCISGIERKGVKGLGVITTVKLKDQNACLRQLNEYMGLFEKKTDDQPNITDDTARQLRDVFAEDD
jgi:hypothetical protein